MYLHQKHDLIQVLFALFFVTSLFLMMRQSKTNRISIKEKLYQMDHNLKNDIIAKLNVVQVDNTTIKEEQKIKRKKNNYVNFHRNPNSFIETLSDCLVDDKCNIFYHHVQKTGGTTLENRMFSAFPFHESRTKHRTCCGRKVIRDFDRKQKYYCQSKFTSYQVSSSQLKTVVSTCMELNSKVSDASKAIVMTSVRDPETR